jgi:glucokinase
MHLLGLDVTGHAVRAVIVNETGEVVRRAGRIGADAAGALVPLMTEASDGLSIDAVGFSAEIDVEGVTRSVRAAFPSAFVHNSTAGAAAVVAEGWIGAARDTRHAICLWIGERVLAGLLLDGRPWPGAHGLAGSAAWLAMNPVERQDYRKFGSLAAEVSNKGIARRLAWRIQAGDHSAVLERAGDLDAITAAHVFEGARTGDGVSISVMRDTAKYIGMAVSNLASAIDPEIIVLGGAAAAAGDLLLEPVRQECARRLPPALVPQLRLEISPLGDDGVAIGAARLAALARA